MYIKYGNRVRRWTKGKGIVKIEGMWIKQLITSTHACSDSVVCIQGNFLSGNLEDCIVITSSSVAENIEGAKMDVFAVITSSMAGFFEPRCRPD